MAIAATFFGEQAAWGKIVEQFRKLLGEQGGRTIQSIIIQASSFRTGTVAAAIGVTMLVAGATAAFIELQDALNTVWEVKRNRILGGTGSMAVRKQWAPADG